MCVELKRASVSAEDEKFLYLANKFLEHFGEEYYVEYSNDKKSAEYIDDKKSAKGEFLQDLVSIKILEFRYLKEIIYILLEIERDCEGNENYLIYYSKVGRAKKSFRCKTAEEVIERTESILKSLKEDEEW